MRKQEKHPVSSNQSFFHPASLALTLHVGFSSYWVCLRCPLSETQSLCVPRIQLLQGPDRPLALRKLSP